MALRHQLGERLVDGVLVEQKLVELFRGNSIGRILVTPVQRVPLILLVLGQIGVVEPPAANPLVPQST
jgi:hypothetical protein